MAKKFTMKDSMVVSLTKSQFQAIITTPVGDHWADKFIRMENLPAPWIGDIADFGLMKKAQMERYSGYQLDTLGKQWLPTRFLPHGTDEDQERYEDVFTTESMKARLGRSFSDSDIPYYLHAYREQIIENIIDVLPKQKAQALIDRVYSANDDTINPSFLIELDNIPKGDQGYKMKWLARQDRAGQNKPSPLMPKHVIDLYLREIKAEIQFDDARAHLFEGLKTKMPKGRELPKFPKLTKGSGLYSAISQLFLRTGSKDFTPRPLFGSSEKTEKSDGTKVSVSVIYLSPAKRSDTDFPNEWLGYFTLPIDTDNIAKSQDLFPKAPVFTDSVGAIGQELQAKYDSARRLYESNGFKVYKNNPKKEMNLCHNPNTCPYAGGCAGLCLVDSGQMAAAYEPMAAGYFKTWYFFLYPLYFIRQLIVECFINAYASYQGKVSFFARLNGTSDIPWERYMDMDALVDKTNAFLEDWNQTQLEAKKKADRDFAQLRIDDEIKGFGGFYDYNKYPYEDRKFFGDWINGKCPKYYDLTFSISEAIVATSGTPCAVSALGGEIAFAKAFEHALEWVRQGFRVACVVEQWKYIPIREFSPPEQQLLQKFKTGKNLNPMEKFLGSILLEQEQRNEFAGINLNIPSVSFSKPSKNPQMKRIRLNQHTLDIFVPKIESDKYAVTDFNTLARTAINSMDDANRGRNILIIDGDETDFRFNDPKPSIVILKPKGISVVSSARGKVGSAQAVLGYRSRRGAEAQFPAGTVYNNQPFSDREGRFNYSFSALNQQFIMTQRHVLQMQDYFLKFVGTAGIKRMMPDTLKALKLKGGVYLDNLLESVQDLDKKTQNLITNEAVNDGIVIANNVPKDMDGERFALLNPMWIDAIEMYQVEQSQKSSMRKKQTAKKTKKNPSLNLQVYQTTGEDPFYYIKNMATGKGVAIDKVQKWYCVESLEFDLDQKGFALDEDWRVVAK